MTAVSIAAKHVTLLAAPRPILAAPRSSPGNHAKTRRPVEKAAEKTTLILQHTPPIRFKLIEWFHLLWRQMLPSSGYSLNVCLIILPCS